MDFHFCLNTHGRWRIGPIVSDSWKTSTGMRGTHPLSYCCQSFVFVLFLIYSTESRNAIIITNRLLFFSFWPLTLWHERLKMMLKPSRKKSSTRGPSKNKIMDDVFSTVNNDDLPLVGQTWASQQGHRETGFGTSTDRHLNSAMWTSWYNSVAGQAHLRMSELW